MADLGSVFAVVCMVSAVIGLFWLFAIVRQETQRARQSAFSAVRQRYGGRFQESFWGGKACHFEVDGVAGKLTFRPSSDDKPPLTKLHFRWSGPSLHVAPEGAWSSVKKFLGATDIQIGERDFDDRFLIQGHPEGWVHKALMPQARKHLKLLAALGAGRSLFDNSGVTLDVGPSGVVIACKRDVIRVDGLQRFVESSVAVLRELMAASGDQVTISIAEVVKAGKCPVCSDAAGDLTKHCSGCATAYHPECYGYLGGCAIFGCGDSYAQGHAQREGGW